MACDICSLSHQNSFWRYGSIEFFVYLLGTGISRSLYMLAAEDTSSGRHLFNMPIEAETQAMVERGNKAGTYPDDELVSAAVTQACKIVDEHAYETAKMFRLKIGSGGDLLV